MSNKETLESVQEYTTNIVDLVNDGHIKPTNAFLLLKQIEKNAKSMREKINDLTIEELHSIGEENKDYKIDGCSISLKHSAGRWDFNHIKEIVILEVQLKELKLKHILAYKNSLNDALSVSNDGEEITPAVFKPGKEIVVVKG
tara:strand:+ start:106 stop:534 length:429 start_codon:yes stop_codon:yes gene_type:complete